MDTSKLLIDFLLERPFFGTILAQTELLPKDTIPTMGTDGKHIYYNPEWVETLTYYEQMGVIAHEVLHIAFLHHVRAKDRHFKKWNIACDMAINVLVRENGFVLPDWVAYDTYTPPRSAEEIYDSLPDSSAYTCFGDVFSPESSSSDLSEEINRVTVLINKALRSTKNLSKGLVRTFNDILNPPIPWKDILSNYLSKVITTDYSSYKYSKRFINNGIYLPDLYKRSLDLIIAVDTSGSIDDQQLSEMIGIIEDLRSQIDVYVKVFYCDAAIAGEDYFEPDDPVVFNPKGGGGTDFRPVFNKLYKEGEIPSVLIYLTDGLCDRYPDPAIVEFPVIWVYFEENVRIECEE